MTKKNTYISIFIVLGFITMIYFVYKHHNNSNAIKSTQVDRKYILGKRIFEKNCVSCHDKKMVEYATAPALGGITKLREKKWLYNYTRNSNKMYEDGDIIAVKLRSENFGLMTSFPNLDDTKLEAVYYYIEMEYEKNKKLKKD